MYTPPTELAAWLRQRVTASGARGIAVGLSGGVDSAVVLRLAQMALQDQVVGVLMPCHSDPRDEADARQVADQFNVPVVRIDLAPAYDRLAADLKSAMSRFSTAQVDVPSSEATDIRARVPLANIKPRLRMSTLYYIANVMNYLVAGTGNRSELIIGYFTKYGDGGVDLLPIGHLLKSEVRALAKALEVPASIIDKPASAGLWIGQTDEDEMGFTYADLERYLTDGPEAVAPALAMRIERLVRASEHKRSLAPMPEADRPVEISELDRA
jgi:NAD+ synthase